MATIKAGTYRFNDVLTKSTNYTVEGAILFNSSVNGETVTCNGIYERSLDDWLTLAYSVYITELGDYMAANVYNDGWYTDDFGDGIKTITIPTDSEVSDDFYAWFTANAAEVVEDTEETPVATIIYGGSVIASLNEGQTATLKCAGMKMESDVVVEVAEQTESTPPNIQPLTITENGTYTAEDGVDGYSPITVEVDDGEGDFSADLYFEGGYAEVNLPNATKIGDYAFYKNATLTNITMPKVTSIGSNAFRECTKLNQSELPNGITSIGSAAFYKSTKLALTKLPSALISISDNAFYSCEGLALTELPSGLQSIGSSAFYNCWRIAFTEIPSSVISISGAFPNCGGLTSITFKGTPTTINSQAFYNCTNIKTINVPWAEGAVANAPWGATNATINYNYTGE